MEEVQEVLEGVNNEGLWSNSPAPNEAEENDSDDDDPAGTGVSRTKQSHAGGRQISCSAILYLDVTDQRGRTVSMECPIM